MWLLFFFALDESLHYQVIKSFQTPDDPEAENVLELPFSIDFSPNGQMFALDSISNKIFVWDKEGRLERVFGRKGQGPGELLNAAKIEATNEAIYVWSYDYRLSKFDFQGNFIDTTHTTLRLNNFKIINDNLFLAAFKNHLSSDESRAAFVLTDGKGQMLKELMSFPNESYLTPPGQIKGVRKSFAPDHVVQKGPNNRWYFGFSQNKTLYQVNEKGELVGEKEFELPAEKPTDAEIELYENLTYPKRLGGRRHLADNKDLSYDYSYEKSFYTHFIFKDGKVAFVLTPMGGMGSGSGHSHASFFINDFETGKLLSRGRYQLPEDSVVLYESGRAIAFIVDQTGEYKIQEIVLRGL